jgi:hypothetical protein
MASKRQIAANRRNARKSTGPRSSAGKRRTSGNSYRHGLGATAPLNATTAEAVERLAREIAGRRQDAVTLEDARTAAQATFDVAQVRRVKIALIEATRIIGNCDPRVATRPRSIKRAFDYLRKRAEARKRLARLDRTAALPANKEGSAEAMRRALPELLKVDRYERRAAARREKALRRVAAKVDQEDNH